MYRVNIRDNQTEGDILIVGCGGTGSFVAEGLCRLLSNFREDIQLHLIDMDRVETHNLRRQNFFAGDVGKFKSQGLAERLSRQYGRRISYSVTPYDPEAWGDSGGGYRRTFRGIIIGCVDNTAARRTISEQTWEWGAWWLDAGNGRDSGQVLLGNTGNAEGLRGAFNKRRQTVSRLPLPSIQAPSLLAPAKEPVPRLDCAEAVEADEQSPTINQVMATLVVDFMYRLLTGKLTRMGAYIDMEAGSLSMVPADPKIVGRMMGMPVSHLMKGAYATNVTHR